MAARPQLPAVETVDLRQVPPGSLDRLLDEETCAWREALAWDFSLSAALVKRFADMQSLAGMALVIGSRVIGYTYTVIDDDKGMVGDLYVLREFASPALEDHLLNATVETIATTSGIRRIESQIILLHHPRPKPLTSSRQPRLFERQFMVLDPRAPMPSGRAAHKLDFDTWHDRLQDDAAAVIASAYIGHVDSSINDQYRSFAGSRRFLTNIVQYPGCGSFCAPASWLGWSPETGRLAGLSLASLVSRQAGHITQLCVAPNFRGQGIGYELLARSIKALREQDCSRVSLTVTGTNRSAIRLYEQMGFRTERTFAAMVWENIRPPRRFFGG